MNFKYYFAFFLLGSFITLHAKKEKLLNKQAPTFSNQAVFPDGLTHELHLKDYQGQNIVLYFYPMDNSPYCTIQARDFKNKFHLLQNNNITVIGISPDSIKSHEKFQCSLQLPYPLVADSRSKIAKKYQATGFLFGKRKTFLINKDGIIFKIFDNINIETQVCDIIQAFATEK